MTTPWKTPLLVAAAADSAMAPSVGPTTLSEGIETRIASRASSASAVVPAVVSGVGDGSGCPLETTSTAGSEISVRGRAFGSEAGENSTTRPVTCTRSTTATAGALPVKTKSPSEVSSRPSSSPAGVCTKNPFDRAAITTPRVVTARPSSGERAPAPCTAWMGVGLASSFSMWPVPRPLAAMAPVTPRTRTKNVSSGSMARSPLTVTSKANEASPSGMSGPEMARGT